MRVGIFLLYADARIGVQSGSDTVVLYGDTASGTFDFAKRTLSLLNKWAN